MMNFFRAAADIALFPFIFVPLWLGFFFLRVSGSTVVTDFGDKGYCKVGWRHGTWDIYRVIVYPKIKGEKKRHVTICRNGEIRSELR